MVAPSILTQLETSTLRKDSAQTDSQAVGSNPGNLRSSKKSPFIQLDPIPVGHGFRLHGWVSRVSHEHANTGL